MKKYIFIAAGGTAGHINAAISMGEEFREDFEVIYLTGTRYLDYQLFKDQNVIHLESKPLRSSSPITLLKNLFSNILVFCKLLKLFMQKKPAFALGAGGYVCGPSLLAAKLLGNKVFIIEQNAVVGLTNRLLAKISDLIFTNFENTKGLENISGDKIKVLGNPIRKSIVFTEEERSDKLKILVFGGSLGATQINEAIEIILKKKLISGVVICHQTGKDNIVDYDESNADIHYKQHQYIDNMSVAYKWANVVVSRAGASTVSELRIVRRPSVLIPFPKATDNHQYLNGLQLKEEGLFPCEVLDHKLVGEELAMELVSAIRMVSTANFENKKVNDEKASLAIRQEILKCLA